MTRGAKTVRNFGIMLAVLAAAFWQSPLYFTSDSCVMDSMESLGFSPCEIICEDSYAGNHIYVLRNKNDAYAIHETQRIGPFWKTAGGATGMDFSSRDGGPLFVTQSGNDTASYIVCKRLSPEIAWVEWRWAYDQTVRADDWTQDILVMVAQQPWEETWGTVTAYNAAGDVVCVWQR